MLGMQNMDSRSPDIQKVNPGIALALDCLWAKSNPYKQLLAHMLDTGCCVKAYLESESSAALLDYLNGQWKCDREESLSLAAYFAALHDIGKATPQFQRQEESQYERLKDQGFAYLFPERYLDKTRHEHDSARIAKRIWKSRKISGRLSDSYAAVLSLHHQRIAANNHPQSIPNEWTEIQNQLEGKVRLAFHAPEELPSPVHMDALCILLTGLIILCDWVASSGPFNECSQTDEKYLEKSTILAEQTMKRYGLIGPRERKNITAFQTIWPQIESPRDIQSRCESLNPAAPITIIEAPMGEGKTEAALYLAEKMCQVWNKRGIYIALPTQATSNQMFGRANEMLERIHGGHARLLHGTAFLQAEAQGIQSDDAQEAERWLGPLRMGLLDENGVGTVDQAMAGVLMARFSVLRLLGLSNKVLAIDELHAYDAYMSGIIMALLRWCRVLRIPVILLSATLQNSQREQYLSCYTDMNSSPPLSPAYPLITQVDETGTLTQMEAEATRKTAYDFQPARLGQDCRSIARFAVEQLKNGGCYCVLVNTVNKAQEVYRALLEIVDAETETMLFHARFPVGRREEIEKECLRRFGKGPENKRPKKAILVATQVVEQSLDLDFDGMFTELAPIDLLLQRAGRVHRHGYRKRPEGLERPVIHVILPEKDASDDLGKRYGSSGYVYAAFLLNNTEHLVERGLNVHVPDDIRKVIARVYEHVTPENLAAWQERSFEQQLMRANASGASFPVPQEKLFFPSQSHPEFINMEVDDGFEPAARASTRIGEPTIRISFSTTDLLEAAKGGHLSKEQSREIFLSSVSLSAKRFGRDLTELDVLYKIEKGMMRGCFITDQHGNIRAGNKMLINDPALGILWKE